MLLRLPHRSVFLLLLALPLGLGSTAAPAAAQGAPNVEATLAEIDGTVLRPVRLDYEVTLKMSGRSVDLSATRTIRAAQREGASLWTVVDRTALPQATVTDSLVLDRTTLRPIERHLSGPRTLSVSYTDTSATGRLQRGGGGASTIDEHFDVPVFAGGTNARLVLAALPLSPNYAARVRVYDGQQQTQQGLLFEVTGVDTVTTPAGAFDTFVVSMRTSTGSDGGTLHVLQRSPHHIVRSTLQQTSPQGSLRTIVRTLTSMKTTVTDAR